MSWRSWGRQQGVAGLRKGSQGSAGSPEGERSRNYRSPARAGRGDEPPPPGEAGAGRGDGGEGPLSSKRSPSVRHPHSPAFPEPRTLPRIPACAPLRRGLGTAPGLDQDPQERAGRSPFLPGSARSRASRASGCPAAAQAPPPPGSLGGAGSSRRCGWARVPPAAAQGPEARCPRAGPLRAAGCARGFIGSRAALSLHLEAPPLAGRPGCCPARARGRPGRVPFSPHVA